MGTVAHVQPMRATLPWRRALRARVGVLEDLSWAAGGGWTSARSLYADPNATLDGVREAVNTLQDADRTVRRVFGGAHPFAGEIAIFLRESRAALCARETPSTSA
jgi:hypothetical protein